MEIRKSEDIKNDNKELLKFINDSKSKNNKLLLQSLVDKNEQELKILKERKINSQKENNEINKNPKIDWKKFDSICFSLEGDFVEIYVKNKNGNLNGISKEKVSCDFKNNSFDLKVIDVDGKNYRYLGENLSKDIVPSESVVLVKPKRIVLKLKKAKDGEIGSDMWMKLFDKQRSVDVDKKKDDKDPMKGINDMMKEMYENGDEKTRAMIGKAMEKSRNGQMGDGL